MSVQQSWAIQAGNDDRKQRECNSFMYLPQWSEFHTISNIQTFFGVEEYCFSCLVLYDRKFNHTSKCGALCLNCRRVVQKLERTISAKLIIRLKLRTLDARKYLKCTMLRGAYCKRSMPKI